VDFKDRANIGSVKNFQIIQSVPDDYAEGAKSSTGDSEREFVMQMGKTTEDCFNMDVKYPLSILQAFAICIARYMDRILYYYLANGFIFTPLIFLRFDAKLTWTG